MSVRFIYLIDVDNDVVCLKYGCGVFENEIYCISYGVVFEKLL